MRAVALQDRKADRLARQPLFSSCSHAQLALLRTVCDEVDVPAGQLLAREGWTGHWLFVIEEGTADVMRGGRRTAVLWAGEHFTENAQGTIRARTPMRLLVIDRRYVDALSALPPAPRKRRRWRPFACVLAAVAIAAAGGVLYHPPVAVLEPGAAFDVSRDITIAGARVYPVSGRYLVTPVRVVRPNGIRVLLALGRPDREVLPAARARAGERERQRQVFRTSERLAAAAAGANGVHIEFRDRDVGGPSAGLIYALAIADLLGPEDIANGRTIAATGTIDAEGNVGSVCCMEQKAESALDAGAGLMLVPAGESEASSFMAVIEVSTLREALARLSR